MRSGLVTGLVASAKGGGAASASTLVLGCGDRLATLIDGLEGAWAGPTTDVSEFDKGLIEGAVDDEVFGRGEAVFFLKTRLDGGNGALEKIKGLEI